MIVRVAPHDSWFPLDVEEGFEVLHRDLVSAFEDLYDDPAELDRRASDVVELVQVLEGVDSPIARWAYLRRTDALAVGGITRLLDLVGDLPDDAVRHVDALVADATLLGEPITSWDDLPLGPALVATFRYVVPTPDPDLPRVHEFLGVFVPVPDSGRTLVMCSVSASIDLADELRQPLVELAAGIEVEP